MLNFTRKLMVLGVAAMMMVAVGCSDDDDNNPIANNQPTMDIVETAVEDLAEIQGFDMDIAGELYNRATEFVTAETARIEGELERLEVAADLREVDYLSLPMMLKLAENDVRSLDDLAELDSEELSGLLGEFGIEDEATAGEIIMAARAHWFADEEADEAEAVPGEESETASAEETEAESAGESTGA